MQRPEHLTGLGVAPSNTQVVNDPLEHAVFGARADLYGADLLRRAVLEMCASDTHDVGVPGLRRNPQ